MKLLSLGAGNMVSALMGPIVEEFDSFSVYSPGQSAALFSEAFEATHVISLDKFDDQIDVLLLSFKPQMFEEAIAAFLKSKRDLEKTLIVSMLAGTPVEIIEKTFNSQNVVRIMPNTPAMVGHGVSLFLTHPHVCEESAAAFKRKLAMTGKVIEAESEAQLDQWTAVTGSGPAYVFEFARILEKILVDQKMKVKDAHEAISQLFLGCSLMMSDGPDGFEEMRQKVTSKNGVTFEALKIFEAQGLEKITAQAIEANIKRSSQLKAQALSGS
jgi:pyrroline-5-carboxylate reductase